MTIHCVPDAWFLFITLVYIIDLIVRWLGLRFHNFKANGWNLLDVVAAVGALVMTIITRAGLTTFLIEQLQKLFLVSIAFKLVQRTNNLKQLSKRSCKSIVSLVFGLFNNLIGRVCQSF